MKQIFVCSQYQGSKKNLYRARAICRYLIDTYNVVPVAPHLYFPQFLREENPVDRWKGIKLGCSLMEKCDEMWVFPRLDERGEHIISDGMKRELQHADKIGIPMKWVEESEFPVHFHSCVDNIAEGVGRKPKFLKELFIDAKASKV